MSSMADELSIRLGRRLENRLGGVVDSVGAVEKDAASSGISTPTKREGERLCSLMDGLIIDRNMRQLSGTAIHAHDVSRLAALAVASDDAPSRAAAVWKLALLAAEAPDSVAGVDLPTLVPALAALAAVSHDMTPYPESSSTRPLPVWRGAAALLSILCDVCGYDRVIARLLSAWAEIGQGLETACTVAVTPGQEAHGCFQLAMICTQPGAAALVSGDDSLSQVLRGYVDGGDDFGFDGQALRVWSAMAVATLLAACPDCRPHWADCCARACRVLAMPDSAEPAKCAAAALLCETFGAGPGGASADEPCIESTNAVGNLADLLLGRQASAGVKFVISALAMLAGRRRLTGLVLLHMRALMGPGVGGAPAVGAAGAAKVAARVAEMNAPAVLAAGLADPLMALLEGPKDTAAAAGEALAVLCRSGGDARAALLPPLLAVIAGGDATPVESVGGGTHDEGNLTTDSHTLDDTGSAVASSPVATGSGQSSGRSGVAHSPNPAPIARVRAALVLYETAGRAVTRADVVRSGAVAALVNLLRHALDALHLTPRCATLGGDAAGGSGSGRGGLGGDDWGPGSANDVASSPRSDGGGTTPAPYRLMSSQPGTPHVLGFPGGHVPAIFCLQKGSSSVPGSPAGGGSPRAGASGSGDVGASGGAGAFAGLIDSYSEHEAHVSAALVALGALSRLAAAPIARADVASSGLGTLMGPLLHGTAAPPVLRQAASAISRYMRPVSLLAA